MEWLLLAGVALLLLSRQSGSSSDDLTAAADDFFDTISGGFNELADEAGDVLVNGFVAAWAEAIATFEGFYQAGSRAQRNHNPGNLRVTHATGQVGNDSGGFAIFATDADGWNALYADLQAKVRKYPNATLAEIMQRYAPASDGNDPNAYAEFIAQQTGTSINQTLGELGG